MRDHAHYQVSGHDTGSWQRMMYHGLKGKPVAYQMAHVAPTNDVNATLDGDRRYNRHIAVTQAAVIAHMEMLYHDPRGDPEWRSGSE